MSLNPVIGQAIRPAKYIARSASTQANNQALDRLEYQAPPGSHSLGLITPTPELKETSAAEAPEKAESGWQRAATIGALALSAVGAGAGLLGAASPAMAQSISQEAVRSTDPVRINSAQDLIRKFSADRQLYIQGHPVSADQEQRLERMLAQNPNVFVVVVDNAGQLESYHGTANHGIGESSAFHSVVDETTGEKKGVVFFVYMDSSQGRKIFMRSEGLPDQLGVGEENFAGPRSSTLIEVFKANVGQGDISAGLGAVARRINTTIETHVVQVVDGANLAVRRAETALAEGREQAQDFVEKNGSTAVPLDVTRWEEDLSRARGALERKDYQAARELAEGVLSGVTGAQASMANYERIRGEALSTVTSAKTALEGVRESVGEFRVEHGEGGLASPNLSGWATTLDQAEKNAAAGQFEAARDAAREVLEAVTTQQELMTRFEQAPAEVTRLDSQLTRAEAIVAGLPEAYRGQAQEALDRARSSYADFQARLASKDTGFYTSQQQASRDAGRAVSEAERSEKLAQQDANVRKLAIGAVAAAIAIAGLVSHQNSKRRRDEARQALTRAQTEIADKTKALMDLLDQADVHKLSNYSGQMGDLVAQLSENVGDALTLMGGADKVLAQSSELIESKSMVNWFSSRNYDKAVALLTDGDARVRFSLSDPSRAVMDGSDQARSWKDELLKRGASRDFEKSLYEILRAMADKRDDAHELLAKLALLEALEKARAAGEGERFQGCLDAILEVRGLIQAGAEDTSKAKAEKLSRAGVVTRMPSEWITPAEMALRHGELLLEGAEEHLRKSDIAQAEGNIQGAREKVDLAQKTVSDACDQLRDLHNREVDRAIKEAAERAREAARRAEEQRRYRESHRHDDDYGGGYGGGSYGGGSSWGGSSGSSGSSDSGSSSSSGGSSWGSGSSGSSWGSGSSGSGSSGSSWGSGSDSSSGSSGSSWGSGSSGGSW